MTPEFLRFVRKWTLVAWAILGTGIFLGGWWAYHVLGWGGYWGWDPVENVSLLPWLTATAFIHSIMVQERRGMLKVWNMGLLLASYVLAIFGTFVVRSGLISVRPLVRAVGDRAVLPRLPDSGDCPGDRADHFPAADAAIGQHIRCGRLTRVRLPAQQRNFHRDCVRDVLGNRLSADLRDGHRDGDDGRPAVLPAGQRAALPGHADPDGYRTVASLATDARAGAHARVDRAAPDWRSSRSSHYCCSSASRWRRPESRRRCSRLATVGVEYWRGARLRRKNAGDSLPVAVYRLARRDPRRYGGYIVHLGVAIIAIGIVGSTFFQTERRVVLNEGESVDVAEYTLVYEELVETRTTDAQVFTAPVDVHGRRQRQRCDRGQALLLQRLRRPADDAGGVNTVGFDDVYVMLTEWDETGAANLHIFINPLVSWIWVGGLVYLFGMVVIFWPAPVARRAAAAIRPDAGRSGR